MQLTLQEYLDEAGRSPFGRWFDGLSAAAAAKVTTALARIEQGNTKKGQAGDIARAHERWADYKQRKGRA
jgi:hypothetical protein